VFHLPRTYLSCAFPFAISTAALSASLMDMIYTRAWADIFAARSSISLMLFSLLVRLLQRLASSMISKKAERAGIESSGAPTYTRAPSISKSFSYLAVGRPAPGTVQMIMSRLPAYLLARSSPSSVAMKYVASDWKVSSLSLQVQDLVKTPSRFSAFAKPSAKHPRPPAPITPMRLPSPVPWSRRVLQTVESAQSICAAILAESCALYFYRSPSTTSPGSYKPLAIL
jgi:hypothetical protein